MGFKKWLMLIFGATLFPRGTYLQIHYMISENIEFNACICLFIHSSGKYLLSAYYDPGTFLCPKDIAVNKIEKNNGLKGLQHEGKSYFG